MHTSGSIRFCFFVMLPCCSVTEREYKRKMSHNTMLRKNLKIEGFVDGPVKDSRTNIKFGLFKFVLS